jgi:prevent-host-death family protein
MEQPTTSSPPQRTVTVREFQERFEELLEAVESGGTHLIITREEVPVAVLMPWSHYRTARERLARLELAYWSAWRDDGTFDSVRLREPVADLVEDLRAAATATEANRDAERDGSKDEG